MPCVTTFIETACAMPERKVFVGPMLSSLQLYLPPGKKALRSLLTAVVADCSMSYGFLMPVLSARRRMPDKDFGCVVCRAELVRVLSPETHPVAHEIYHMAKEQLQQAGRGTDDMLTADTMQQIQGIGQALSDATGPAATHELEIGGYRMFFSRLNVVRTPRRSAVVCRLNIRLRLRASAFQNMPELPLRLKRTHCARIRLWLVVRPLLQLMGRHNDVAWGEQMWARAAKAVRACASAANARTYFPNHLRDSLQDGSRQHCSVIEFLRAGEALPRPADPHRVRLADGVWYDLVRNRFFRLPGVCLRGGYVCDLAGSGTLRAMVRCVAETISSQVFHLTSNILRHVPTLIVCEARMLPAWRTALAEAGLSVLVAHGPSRLCRIPQARLHDVVVTTYGILRIEHAAGGAASACGAFFHPAVWYRVVFDDSHRLRCTFKATAVVRDHVAAKIRWALSPSPHTNRFDDVTSQLKCLHALGAGGAAAANPFLALFAQLACADTSSRTVRAAVASSCSSRAAMPLVSVIWSKCALFTSVNDSQKDIAAVERHGRVLSARSNGPAVRSALFARALGASDLSRRLYLLGDPLGEVSGRLLTLIRRRTSTFACSVGGAAVATATTADKPRECSVCYRPAAITVRLVCGHDQFCDCCVHTIAATRAGLSVGDRATAVAARPLDTLACPLCRQMCMLMECQADVTSAEQLALRVRGCGESEKVKQLVRELERLARRGPKRLALVCVADFCVADALQARLMSDDRLQAEKTSVHLLSTGPLPKLCRRAVRLTVVIATYKLLMSSHMLRRWAQVLQPPHAIYFMNATEKFECEARVCARYACLGPSGFYPDVVRLLHAENEDTIDASAALAAPNTSSPPNIFSPSC